MTFLTIAFLTMAFLTMAPFPQCINYINLQVNGNDAEGSGGGVFVGTLQAQNTLTIITGSTVACSLW